MAFSSFLNCSVSFFKKMIPYERDIPVCCASHMPTKLSGAAQDQQAEIPSEPLVGMKGANCFRHCSASQQGHNKKPALGVELGPKPRHADRLPRQCRPQLCLSDVALDSILPLGVNVGVDLRGVRPNQAIVLVLQSIAHTVLASGDTRL